ncbi:MAG: hypothetical protein IIY31_04910 [Desulfovibrio sp.]|nr:hypothetical protein [Desulfovibrio sp.]
MRFPWRYPWRPCGAAPAKEPALACGSPPSAELAFKVLKAAYPEGIVERMTEIDGVQCALVNGISVPLARLGRRNAVEAIDVACRHCPRRGLRRRRIGGQAHAAPSRRSEPQRP